jgi:VWFA-related protein
MESGYNGPNPMKHPVSLIAFASAAALCLSPFAIAQNASDLPSAPSSTMQQQQKPAPPVAQPQPQPPAQTAPATSTPAPSQTAATTPAATPGADKATPQANQPDLTHDENDQPLETIRKRVNEVNVIFTVTDKHGHYVKDLHKDDFAVKDDNRPAQSVLSFRSETDLPLRVGLLIDASNSVRDRFRFEQEAAIEFLNQIVRPRSDRAFVIGFDTTPEVTQDFTDNTAKLSKGVHMLRAGGGTALYDALFFACRDKLAKADQERGSVRRAIILLSDGDDNQSRVTREEAIEMAERAEVIVYTISTNVSGMKQRGDKVLERIADATGGRAFFPFKIQDVANAFSEIQDELRSQYALGYKPADLRPDGRYHSIDIEAVNNKHLRVRARRGYYAPTQ